MGDIHSAIRNQMSQREFWPLALERWTLSDDVRFTDGPCYTVRIYGVLPIHTRAKTARQSGFCRCRNRIATKRRFGSDCTISEYLLRNVRQCFAARRVSLRLTTIGYNAVSLTETSK